MRFSLVEEQFPLVEELSPPPDVEFAFARWRRLPGCLWLDSALRHPELGRYSFLAADPFDTLLDQGPGDPLTALAARLAAYATPAAPGLPPFQGGAAGLIGYGFHRRLERVAAPRFDDLPTPDLALGWYDLVLAFDHVENRAWLVSQGLPEIEPAARRRRAARRLAQARAWLEGGAEDAAMAAAGHPTEPAPGPLAPAALVAPRFAVPGPAGLLSNFSAEGYLAALRRAIEYVHAGDVFQVNLSQRLLFPARQAAADLYLKLRRRNPAPFAGYFDGGAWQIASASPERFLQARQGVVETRPIKGTRRRTFVPEADLFAGEELRQCDKDRAENVMIVDLLRNDLSRVCRPDSVRVARLCGLEVYAYVQHLVSVVRGELADGASAVDLTRAAFPGGSVTGAPKPRALEIIAELEPTARGPYCGALGYFGFDGGLDSNILIRTITQTRGWLQLPVGGGIVADSEPAKEYDETWAKAAGLLAALE